MNDVRLLVEPPTISLRTSAPATGSIALVVRDVVFPVEGWNDFVVVILEAWATALVRILQRSSETESVHFMEGPYVVELTRLTTGAIQVRALERSGRERVVTTVMSLVLAEDALLAAQDVVTYCRSQGHRSRDFDRLETAVLALRGEVAQLTN